MTAPVAGGGVREAISDALSRLHEAHNAAVGKRQEAFAEAHGNLTEARATVEAMADALVKYDAALMEYAESGQPPYRQFCDAMDNGAKVLAAYRGEAATPAKGEHGIADHGDERASKEMLVPCDCGCGRSCCACCGTDLGFIAEQPATPAGDGVASIADDLRAMSALMSEAPMAYYYQHPDGRQRGPFMLPNTGGGNLEALGFEMVLLYTPATPAGGGDLPELHAEIDEYFREVEGNTSEFCCHKCDLLIQSVDLIRRLASTGSAPASSGDDGAPTDERGFTPHDWDAPDWKNAGRVHDWKNYVSEEVRAKWATFSAEMKMMLARQADEAAGNEEWE